MNVTPIGGKSPSSTLVGVAVDAAGVVKVKRVWETEKVTVMESTEIRDTNKHDTTALDVGDVGGVSLRIRNTTGKGFTLSFYTDNVSGAYYMFGPSDSSLSVQIGTQVNSIVTPDHAPVLNWLQKLKLRVQFDTAPTDGIVEISAMLKR